MLVAAVAFGATVALLALRHHPGRSIDPLGVVLAAISCWPLLAHRRAPLGVFALSTSASAAMMGLGYELGPPFGPTCALFYLAVDPRTQERLRHTAAVVLGFAAVHVSAATIPNSEFPAIPILGAIVLWGGAWIVGDQLRQRRQRLAELVERAERAERETERERRLAAAEERTRIARDLHDSAAHAINVILVQAGGARLLQQQDPQAVRTALTTIEDVARETIGDIDRLIRGLRDGGHGNGNGHGVEPPIGLAAAEALLARHRAAGLTVQMRVEGVDSSLPPGLDQAAYRILQESLTNAARHGSGCVEVRLTYGEQAVELTVSNPARPANGNRVEGGHGIQGMHERATLLGGSLEINRDDGHFRVRACLPYTVATPSAL